MFVLVATKTNWRPYLDFQEFGIELVATFETQTVLNVKAFLLCSVLIGGNGK